MNKTLSYKYVLLLSYLLPEYKRRPRIAHINTTTSSYRSAFEFIIYKSAACSQSSYEGSHADFSEPRLPRAVTTSLGTSNEVNLMYTRPYSHFRFLDTSLVPRPGFRAATCMNRVLGKQIIQVLFFCFLFFVFYKIYQHVNGTTRQLPCSISGFLHEKIRKSCCYEQSLHM